MKRCVLYIFLFVLCLNGYSELIGPRLDKATSDLEIGVVQSDLAKIISSLERLASVYDDLDELDSLDQVRDQLIGFNAMHYGENSAEVGNAICKSAAAKIKLRENETARELLNAAETLIKGKVGTDHPYYASVLTVKATLDYMANKLQSAANYYQRAAEIYAKTILLSQKELSKYRSDYAASIAMKQYSLALAGQPSEEFQKDFQLIDRLFKNASDEIAYSDALYLKASLELKYRHLYQAWKDTEQAAEILKKNLGKRKIYKSINMASQLANILHLLHIFQDADILLDRQIADLTAEPSLNKYGILGTLYLLKATGYSNMNVYPEDAEYYASKAIDKLKYYSYLKPQHNMAKYLRSVALNRLGENTIALREAKESFEYYNNNVYTIEDLEKKYIYWLNYADIQKEISLETANDIYLDIAEAYSKECSRYSNAPQFASFMSGFLIQLAQLTHANYLNDKTHKSFLKAEKAWKTALDFTRAARGYEDVRAYNHNLANLYAINSDTKKAFEYAEGFYEYMASGLLPTLGMLSSKERERFQKDIVDFSVSTVPAIVGNRNSGPEVELLLNSSLLSKSMLLFSEMQINDIVKTAQNSELNRLYSEYIKCKSALTDASTSGECLAQLTGNLKSAETALLRHPIVSKYNSRLEATDWRTIQKALHSDEAIVDFIETRPHDDNAPSKYLAIVLKSDGNPELVHLPSISGLSSEFDFESIYPAVWQPLANHLKDVDRIYFSPAGYLHNLPIECFTKTGHPTFLRLSSLSEILKRGKVSSHRSGEAILFGGLKYEDVPELVNDVPSITRSVPFKSHTPLSKRAGVAFLPATLSEVTAISQSLSSNNVSVRLFTGASGSEEQFKALSGTHPSIIHFATHGFYYSPDKTTSAARSLRKMFLNDNSISESDRAMFRTGLLLSGANYKLKGRQLPEPYEDGILTAAEISTTDLYGTSLVVLSACQSGLGDVSAEGVFGMPRALKKAGVQTVVMSLWKVDDEATALLMKNFYRFYTQCHTPSESLAKAQESLKNDNRFSHPRYWAAFVVLDDVE